MLSHPYYRRQTQKQGVIQFLVETTKPAHETGLSRRVLPAVSQHAVNAEISILDKMCQCDGPRIWCIGQDLRCTVWNECEVSLPQLYWLTVNRDPALTLDNEVETDGIAIRR
jgi:hypothetical protein